MRPLRQHLAAAGLGLVVLFTAACSQPSAVSAADAPKTDTQAEPAHVAAGPEAPDFTLRATDGSEYTLSKELAAGKTVVLEWFNPDCPVSKAYHQPERRMNATYSEVPANVVWFAINSGGAGKQGAGLERNQRAVTEYEIPYPVLLDESGAVGRAYGAKTTPHMIVVAPPGVIAYDGAIDDGGPGQQATTNYVLAALTDLAAGRDVATPKTKPFGCSVKYGD
ncbi:MAG: redoxin family protein [Planctomycetes bacterium]|nr:redoxin family protein [Planctomycetota bacterium]